MVALWAALLRSGLPPDILEDVNFAIYGLGDSSYEKFCYAGKILARRMISLGANLLRARTIANTENGSYPILDQELERKLRINEREDDDTDEFGATACLAWGDERAPEGYEETFLPWLDRTTSAMLPMLHPPPPATLQVPPTTSLPPPLYRICKVSHTASVPSVKGNGVHDSQKNMGESLSSGDDELEPGWIWTRLGWNKRVTDEGWFQDVREIHLELEQALE
ncbi:hypothetical protein QFC19_000091 [Naganishia cerealis]|uniref:Uncharacterized protein n=1 Tax=Naganishia cerealis TaxID=610337 RepID=A0ACC2WTN9_9TREE|nr:hypothetical protein QFC19_000091 [Naganishia cerealis]